MQATKETKNYTGVQPVITLWKQTSKNGKSFFTGNYRGSEQLIGFYNTHKSNPNQPDLQVSFKDHEGKIAEQCASLWCKVAKSGNKYLSGELANHSESGERIFLKGFIQNSDNPKAPYVKIYLESELNAKSEEPKPADFEKPVKESKPKNNNPF